MLALVNEARARPRSCGATAFDAAPPLDWDPDLEIAASRHSDDMATHDFFSHTGSDGGSVGDRATAAGFAWSAIGENIAAGQANADVALRGWLDSPGHCSNLMNPSYTSLGMACTSDSGASWVRYWTQVLGRAF